MIKNKKLTLQDANGKNFETSIDNLLYDLSIADLEEGCSLDVYDADKVKEDYKGLQIVDAEGNLLDVTTLNDSKDEDKIIALDVLAEVTHSGNNANSVAYYPDSMEKDAASFREPFPKPLIMNHDTYSEPIGRVASAGFTSSELTDRDTIEVTFKVTDEDAIPKFLDGRYRTVSIGASPGRVTCEICKKDILKDGIFKFCGHWRGETYDNVKAIWACRDLTYNEVSVVNNPADKWAQVKRITVVRASATGKKAEDMAEEKTPLTDESLINQILTDAETPEAVKVPAVESTDEIAKDSTEPQKEEQKDEASADLLGQIKDELAATKTDLEEQKTKVQSLQDELTRMSTEKAEINDKLITAEAESQAARDQSLRLAVKYKEVLVDSIRSLSSVVQEKLNDEEVAAMAIKDLVKLSDALKAKIPAPHTTPTPATNPGVVDNTKPGVINAKDNEQNTNTRSADYSDLMNGMISSAAR